jgi:hypothetical protein
MRAVRLPDLSSKRFSLPPDRTGRGLPPAAPVSKTPDARALRPSSRTMSMAAMTRLLQIAGRLSGKIPNELIGRRSRRCGMLTARPALCPLVMGSVVVLGGCTTFQYSGQNNLSTPVIYTASVDGEGKASTSVNPGSSLSAQTIGDFRRGKKVQVDISLVNGGRIATAYTLLPSKPDPFLLNLVTPPTIPGTSIDLNKESNVTQALKEAANVDISNSYSSPAATIDNLAVAAFNGVWKVTLDASDPEHPNWGGAAIISPADLGSAVPTKTFLSSKSDDAASYYSQMYLDKEGEAKVAVVIPTVGSLGLNYNQADIYQVNLTFKDVGWRTSPVSWYSLQRRLSGSEDGKAILANLATKFSQLSSNERLVYLNAACILSGIDATAYQMNKLGIDADVNASTIFTASGAYSHSTTQKTEQKADNSVYRVRYQVLTANDLQPFSSHAER